MTLPLPGLDAFAASEALRDAYLRYYDTAFRLRQEPLQAERHDLLARAGSIYTDPYIELRPDYATTTRPLEESTAYAGAPGELARFAALGLLQPGMKLYTHQEQALVSGMQRGRNAVVTAGTGSGKTEAFLLPILADLLQESNAWTGGPAQLQPWWESGSQPFQSQRTGEHGQRQQAVRAMVLYPMNALVDDQLVRLRRALDSDSVRQWLDGNRLGHRFYFGRYTGATPVTGSRDFKPAVDKLRSYLKETAARGRRAREQDDTDARYFVPRLDGAEMRSRWDMYDAPPDIMITNYSMLNVMLQRTRDQDFFRSTAEWLHSTDGARFTLVVDELHMYRGTAGTEIAYLIRNLKNRLGITDRPDKLRVLAASASLDETRREDRCFLQEFFALEENSFDFIPGEPAPRPTGSPDISSAAPALAAAADTRQSPAEARQLLQGTQAAEAILKALGGDGSSPSNPSRPAPELAAALFPRASNAEALLALRGATASIRNAAADGTKTLPELRIHLFFRNIAGMWACTDPACPEVDDAHADPGRRIGRIYTVPRSSCNCGARVLELLYCQSCGEAMLGGYAPRTAFGRGTFSSFLLPDSPDLSRVPDQSGRDRTAANYVVYWPTDQPQRADDDAAWTVGPAKFAFRRSQLDPATGRLQNGGGSTTGWSFHVTSTRSRDTGQARQDTAALPPFPTRCPCCGADWERRYDTTGKQRAASDPARFQSPVRTMRTGFEKINQVLSDELVEQFSKPSERKLIVFTDSRQDAAKLAAGMALRHYQDLVRLLALEELHASAAPVSDIGAVKLHADGDRSPEVLAAMARLGAKHPAAFNELRLAWIDGEAKHAEAVAQRLAEPPTLDALAKNHVFGRLVALGVNPAGTLHSKQRYGNTDWYEIFDWDMKPPAMASASPAQQEVALASEDGLLDNALEALFSGAGRDVESLGVGLVGPAPQPADPDGLGQASLRILAEMRRFPAMRDASDAPPPRLRDFWKAVAALRGWQYDDVRDTAERAWGGAVFQYLIDPRKAAVRPSPGRAWKCAACGRRHLSPAAGVCTRCHSALPAQPAPDTAPQDGDYYAWKARKAGGGFRLNCAELTGQTGRIEAQSRQARFQGVFLSDRGEIPLVHEIDLLSVTTTMEAGVDIGPLSAVAMANMPPSRFNYQQRVGRAGRRSSPVAVALTVCRGRSHDEHYFANPAAITNDPTPPPYLTLQQPQIMRRAMNAEILRLSFQHLSDHGGTNNPHGEFGLAEDWADAEQDVRAWLDSHGDLVGQALHALSAYTPLDTAPYQDGSWIASLLAEVSEAAQAPTGAPELSERLAHAGVLPMFGFPTRVRQLYLEVPGKNATWPPELAVDRDIALAVSQFAPGGEVVKDGQVYTVVGVTEFEPAPGRAPQPVAEPLEHSRRVGLCRVCNHIEEAPTTDPLCPLCRADNYQVVDLREPAGFRAREPRDFDGNFAWSPRTVSSRATADFNSLSFMPYLGSHVYSGPGNRFVVNDNNGDLFSFQRASGRWGGYIESRIAQEDKGEKGYGSPIEGIALGAVLPTDFFFIGPSTTTDAERGYRLNLSPAAPAYGADINDGRRAAWYSLAFLLRGTAALHLDVGRQELLAGIHHGAHPDGHAVYAFLADSLENGAGFSTHLGSRQGIDPFMDSVHTFIEQLHQREHADLCTSSCYRCLRDYSNMAYHSLLDWRLAADLFAVLTNGHLSPSGPRAIAALDGLRSLLKGTLIDAGAVPALTFTAKGSPWALIVKHPLAACDLDLVSPELSDTLDAALAHTRNAKRIIVADWFTLEKSPMQVLDRLNAGY